MLIVEANNAVIYYVRNIHDSSFLTVKYYTNVYCFQTFLIFQFYKKFTSKLCSFEYKGFVILATQLGYMSGTFRPLLV